MELRNNRKGLALSLALIAVLGVATVVALASSGSSDAAPTESSPGGETAAQVEAGSDQRNPNFDVLRPASDEALAELPPLGSEWLTMVQRLPQPSASITEFSPEQIAAVSEVGSGSTAGGNVAVFGAVGDLICAVQLEPNAKVPGTSACGQSDQTAAGEIFTATPVGCDAYRLWGIMPSGVSEVSISGAGQMTVPVRSNVYEAEVEPAATVVSGKFESGEAFEVEVPLDKYAAMDGGC